MFPIRPSNRPRKAMGYTPSASDGKAGLTRISHKPSVLSDPVVREKVPGTFFAAKKVPGTLPPRPVCPQRTATGTPPGTRDLRPCIRPTCRAQNSLSQMRRPSRGAKSSPQPRVGFERPKPREKCGLMVPSNMVLQQAGEVDRRRFLTSSVSRAAVFDAEAT
jgi:hypothetical protein